VEENKMWVKSNAEVIAEIIKRGRRRFDVPKFSFRFVGATKEEAEQIIAVMVGMDGGYRSFNDDRGVVLTIRLNVKSCSKFIRLWRKLDIRPSVRQSLRASLLTERDSSGCSLPAYALEIIKETGCRVEFSFTVI
jgi:hypothetical protein